MMDLPRSLGTTWFVDYATFFVILHEDQRHDFSCKFFREDLVCEILFDYLVCGCRGRSREGGVPRPPFFLKKINESGKS